jgi:S1-C subfamily serine protease
VPAALAALAFLTGAPSAGPAASSTPSALAADQPAADAYAAALERALGVEQQLVDTLARVRQATVSVRIMKNVPPTQSGALKTEKVLAGCGSGVLVTFGGKMWVITNHHVAGEADGIEVMTLGAKEPLPAELVDTVKHYDIALLRIPGKPQGLKPVAISPQPSRDLVPGQWVLATGNPFFLALDGRSVSTLGVVSGTDRVLGGDLLYGSAIQHDAAVNPGNSGGPLWNLKGDLIGINGMIASRGGGGVGASNTGASFSIPIYQIQPYLAKLADAKQDAQAGFLGVQCDTATDAKGTPNGALVTDVHPLSPAAGPGDGLRRGDVITSITVTGKPSVPVQTSGDLVNALTVCPAGTQVRIRFRRGRSEQTWTGKLGAEK